MANSVFLLAKKYFPKLWNRQRIDALHDAGQLSDAEYQEIIGEN